MPANYTYTTRVRAQELAHGSVLGHPRLLEHLEAAMVEAWREAAGSPPEALGPARRVVATTVSLEHRAPAHWDDLLEIEVTPARVGETSFTHRYECRVGDDVVARAEVRYVCLDAVTGRPAKLPPAVRLAFGGAAPDPLSVYERFARAQAEFYRGGPLAPVAALLSDDVVWDVPGDNAIAGHYSGRDAVLEYFGRRRDATGATFTITTHRVLCDERGVVAFSGGRAELNGADRTWETIGLYEVRDGTVCAGALVPLDQAAFDAAWSEA